MQQLLPLGPTYEYSQRWFRGRANYRPSQEPIDPSNFTVEPLDRRIAKAFIERHHYSHSFPYEISSFGLFYKPNHIDRSSLVGVASFTTASNPSTFDRWVGLVSFRQGCELGRFVLRDFVGGNGETFFLSRAFRLLKQARPEIIFVLSYSDPVPRLDLETGEASFRGHAGSAYQSGNALYCGRSDARVLTLGRKGETIPNRLLSKIRNDECGAGYSAERLSIVSGVKRYSGESGASFVNRALASPLIRRVRHAGNHVYGFPLAVDRREKAAIMRLPKVAAHRDRGLPYPKFLDDAV